MWQQEFLWFFTIFHHEFRKNNAIAFEVLMVLAVAHLFGFYNPKQLADFLDVPHQRFYTELKEWSVYHVKKMLLRCTYSWFSGRYHKVIRGQDLLGIVLTINHLAFPLHLLFCPKQGRHHTRKADLLIFMLTRLKSA